MRTTSSINTHSLVRARTPNNRGLSTAAATFVTSEATRDDLPLGVIDVFTATKKKAIALDRLEEGSWTGS